METMNSAMSAAGGRPASFEDYCEAAAEVARELRRTGAERDRAGAPPYGEVDLLRSSGILPATLPKPVGGGGLAWGQAMQLVRIVARGDCSIGQLLGYHYLICCIPSMSAPGEMADRLAVKTAAENLYWAGTVNPRGPQLTLTASGDSYRLNGTKTFATGASIADYLVVRAIFDGNPAALILPRTRAGIEPRFDWNNIGQRLTESGTIDFRDVEVQAAELLGQYVDTTRPGETWRTMLTPMMQLVFVNFYVGCAEGALEEAIHYVRETTTPWQTSGVSRATDDPYILELCGMLRAELLASAALADQAGDTVDRARAAATALTPEDRTRTAAHVYAAKVNATRVSLEVTARIFEMMGARATASKYGFDRYWRDVRTHTLHDPVAYKAKEVGNYALNGAITADPLYT